MSKDFRKGNFTKGVTMGESDTTNEATQKVEEQEITEYETNEEGTKILIRANEEDFIQGLIDAAEYASEETQRIEIVREGRLYFAFHVRPLSSQEYEKCKKKYTKYVRNKQFGMKLPEDTDRIKYQSAIIYEATVEEDRKNLWDNHKVWNALNAKEDRIMNGLDVIEYSLKAGEKDKVLEAIDKLSGYDDNLEEVAKN
ncbi:MAG: hypothetical protein OSJ73_16110 [Lachnospiraceae bacterium]|jgi:hypothetical protein|nr:hypothetical protein [Lachnospiraceae bacterium]HBV84510.1 hypothetical protein [Lachnospiraceae bacterium]